AFAVGLALFTGLLVGLVPALRTDTRQLQEALRAGAQGVIRGGSSLQRMLVAGEVALAVMLVAGAGLLLNSFWHINRVEAGIRPERAFVFRTDLPDAAYETPESAIEFYRSAVERIAAIPGVQHVGLTDRVPMLGGYNITVLESPDDPELEAKFVEVRRVTPGFFPAAGIPLLEGRPLTEEDGLREAEVVVISDVLASALFPDGNAVGERIYPGWNEDGYEVVGVVGSVREFGVTRDRRPALYWPFPVPNFRRDFVFVVRTAGDEPLAVLPSIRRAIAPLDPNLPLYGIMTLEDAVLARVGNRRFATALFAVFGVLALALSALGIFGVLAFAVEQRTREVGIRIALGATGRSVIRMVVGQGLRLVVLGLVVGILAAVAASDLLAGLLFQVEPADALTLTLVTAVALGTAAAACYLPARRAARIEPMRVLREE
ncbi:MAG: FtsX-like permease family protein, partial [Gammaproteobacteria bacterium]|nr:FtsX-like permease family protein [Gemmatimonadota bacterium]NIU72892.1 FtsX-like permease family protein [Gammaproteobacteria bacterium]